MIQLIKKMNMLYDAALALVYPQACEVCNAASVEARSDAPACAPCWQKTRVFTGDETLCWKCGALAPGEVSAEHRESVRCRRCEAESFTAARAIGVYEMALRATVLKLKHEPHVGRRVARLLHEAQQRAPLDRATRIIPTPLHETRERERGFNQAAVLGHTLAAISELPIDEQSLVRGAGTEHHRAGMDSRGRRESVEDAFEIRRQKLIEGERVLLIDDVFTTGATASACAKALRAAGAQEVFVLTVARA